MGHRVCGGILHLTYLVQVASLATALAPDKGEDARRVTQLLGSAAELIVSDKDVARMDSLERVRWSVRRTTLTMSLVDHMLDALNSWEPPSEEEPAPAADIPQTLR